MCIKERKGRKVIDEVDYSTEFNSSYKKEWWYRYNLRTQYPYLEVS